MPVAYPVPAPLLTVASQPMAVQDILPGTQNQPVAQLSITASARSYGRLEELMFIDAYGSSSITQNAYSYTLKADLDGNKTNGCETAIAWASADYNTGILNFNVNQTVWARPGQSLKLEVDANMSTYLQGNSFGLEPVLAGFRDLSNQMVPDSNISYVGTPTLHIMETSTVGISQMQLPQAKDVKAGDSMDLLRFNVWNNNNAALTSMSFVASMGSVINATNWKLAQDTNGDGVVDYTYSCTLKQYSPGSPLFVVSVSFPNFPGMAVSGNFDLYATAGPCCHHAGGKQKHRRCND